MEGKECNHAALTDVEKEELLQSPPQSVSDRVEEMGRAKQVK